MLAEFFLICVAHGIVSTAVHGLPAFIRVAKILESKGCTVAKSAYIGHVVIWTTIYTVLTPVAFHRLLSPNKIWVEAYEKVLLEAFTE